MKAKRRSTRDVRISFDEWNVWYHERKADAQRMRAWNWPEAPRLLEDIYNMEDVLQVGGILNTFIRRSDVVRIACIAQLVNVIAPIMTEPGGAAWRQTIYYPFLFASKHGRGTALQLAVDVPTYDAAAAAGVPWLDIAGVHDADAGTLTFFAINRHASETMETDLALEGFSGEVGRAHDHPPRRPRGEEHHGRARHRHAAEGRRRPARRQGSRRSPCRRTPTR